MTYLAPNCSAWVALSRARLLAWCATGEEACKEHRVLAGSLVPGLGSAADGPMLLASPTTERLSLALLEVEGVEEVRLGLSWALKGE